MEIITFFITLFIIILPISGVISLLALNPYPTFSSSSGIAGSTQCTKNSDETYAICASWSSTAIKYNLQPFSYSKKGQSGIKRSCSLYETPSQSTSRAICGTTGSPSSTVYFFRVSDMTVNASVTIGVTGDLPHAVVDTPNQVAFVSNGDNPPAIYKITNIGGTTPIVAGNLTTFGFADNTPTAMLIIDGFLYVHFAMWSSRLGRINISAFTWNKTVPFESGEDGGFEDNVANDDNFIYDVLQIGILVRCTYKNNNFARLDFLNTGFGETYSLAISPDQRTLFVASYANSRLQMVDVASFAMFGNVATVGGAFGRPIITSWCNVYSFSRYSDWIYSFRLNSSVCQTPSAVLTASATVSAQRTMTRSTSPSISKDSSSISHNASLTVFPSESSTSLTISPIETASATPSQLTATDDATSSASHDTHSISADASNTKSSDLTPSPPNISLSSSSSVSRIKSTSFSSSRSKSAIVPPPPYISPLREVYETMATTSSLLSLASMASANVLGAVRARSALRQFSDIVAGTCGLDAESLNDLETSPPDRSSAPAQLKINGNYLTGQAVGNLIVIVGVGVLCTVGYVAIHGRSSANGNNNSENQKLEQKDKKKKNKNKWKNKKPFAEIVIASNAHGMMLFAVMLLLEPTLSSSAISLIGEIVVERRTFTFLSVVCVVLSWLVLLAVGLGWPMWKLIHVRDCEDDEFELLEEKEENDRDGSKEKFWFRRFVEYTTSPFGEWKFKGHRRKEKIRFELARPFIEPFTQRFPKFIVIDIGVIVILSLAEVIPRMVPSDAAACLIRGVTICAVLSLHVLLIIYYRPVFSDRCANTVGCLVDTLSVVVVAGAMSFDENNVNQIDQWSRVAIAQAVCQMVMSVLQAFVALFPMWDGGIELAKKLFCSSSKSKKTDDGQNRNQRHHVTEMMMMVNAQEPDESCSSPLLREMTALGQHVDNKKRKLVTKRKLVGRESQVI